LVISHLNGRDSSDGSTLYLIAGDSGQVEKQLPRQFAFDQSAPWVEGLTGQKVLSQDSDGMVIIDFGVDPPKVTDVMADIFGLDIDSPDETSASASLIDPSGQGYYLAVRLNHPRNQATYLYYSETGDVHIYDHENHTLLLFPDGQLVEMPKLTNVATFRDEYDLVRVEAPGVVQPRLTFTGHVPREYPHLSLKYLTPTSQIVVASAHGVSLVSLPTGEMVAYWELVGDGYSPVLLLTPDGSKFVAVKDYGGLYGPLP
jgi:hypothetical protein